MSLTRNFKETILVRVERDAAFRRALLAEVEQFLASDVKLCRTILREYFVRPLRPEPTWRRR
jgi:hypothetical protein